MLKTAFIVGGLLLVCGEAIATPMPVTKTLPTPPPFKVFYSNIAKKGNVVNFKATIEYRNQNPDQRLSIIPKNDPTPKNIQANYQFDCANRTATSTQMVVYNAWAVKVGDYPGPSSVGIRPGTPGEEMFKKVCSAPSQVRR